MQEISMEIMELLQKVLHVPLHTWKPSQVNEEQFQPLEHFTVFMYDKAYEQKHVYNARK